ncbi:OmpA family protein [Minwuia thermotolerans]|uniref:OmpA family protein n=1 Tax=Minwuia thermotolerans TaxID=2056226 RepID=UPI000F6378A7|nr:OmpA family protein [Minwuia thermotolerans]
MSRLPGIGAGAVILAALAAAPAMAQYDGATIIIDGGGVRTADDYAPPSVSVDPTMAVRPGSVLGSSVPDRATKPFNTSRGPVMAPTDTSLPPHQANRGDRRITLRPPGQDGSRPVPAPRASVRAEPAAPQPAPKRAAEPAREQVRAAPAPQSRPQPTPTPEPAPQPRPEAVPEPKPESERVRVAAPAAPETVERPARQAAAPAPAPRPEPAPAPEPAPEPEPRVAAVPAQAAAPGVTRILFEGAEVDVPAAERDKLTEIARAVQDGNDRIQVRAYADSETETSDWKRRVSLRRAQTVRRILLDNGVESFRILVRALGEPADEGPGNRVDVEIASR